MEPFHVEHIVGADLLWRLRLHRVAIASLTRFGILLYPSRAVADTGFQMDGLVESEDKIASVCNFKMYEISDVSPFIYRFLM